ncbi:hypothetical protein [Euryhalocaulis caribicus]|uniref:hypothetical protein n=1 Tax=Euryhalocaulis caribicus TaxID=1161401 RepID=UPI00039E5409|nr:hypothetical protein [Euryhalocaulis caribicus]
MKQALLILGFVLFTLPAFAAAPEKSGKSEAHGNRYQAGFTLESPEEEAEPPEDNGRGVEIPTLVVPVFEDGRLLNYVFVSVRLQVADGVDPWKVRGRTHYVRDAMIRAAHKQSLGADGNGRALDREKAAKVWMATANETLGGESITGIHFLTVDSRS